MSRLGLVFQIGSLGDSIQSLPAMRSLRELLPDCAEYILVDRFDDADKVVPLEVLNMIWRPWRRVTYLGSGSRVARMLSIASLITRLRHYRPYYAVYLMPSDRSAAQIRRDRAFFRAIGVKEFVGFQTPTGQERGGRECPSVKCSEAYLRLRRLWGERADEKFSIHGRVPVMRPDVAARGRVAAWLDLHRRFQARPLVAVCPFSNWSSKDLSLDNTAELIRMIERDAGVEAVLAGGAKDFTAARCVLERARGGLNACGAFPVAETAALLEKCSLAITVDSGPMHLAAAVGIPTVVVYSRTNEHLDRWFPLGFGHRILYRDVSCAGCGERTCPVPGHPCIDGIDVQQIFDAALEQLRRFTLPCDQMVNLQT